MGCHRRFARRLTLALAVLTVALAGCRTMPAEDRPFTQTRTYYAATAVDPEPHVLNITVHTPNRPLDFSTPRRMQISILSGTVLQLRDAVVTELFGRTLGVHSVGHVMIELKSTDPHTGQTRYLLTAMNAADPGEWADQILGEKVGYAVLTRGLDGTIDGYDRVANDVEEPAAVGTPSARLRVLLTPDSADRMFRFYETFVARGAYERLAMASDPLAENAASCASLAVALLKVGGVFDPAWETEWQQSLAVPEALYGEPEVGKKVPLRRLLIGPQVRRWAAPHEPHRCLSFYDPTLMHQWIVRHATHSTDVECRLGQLLAVPVATIDTRGIPVEQPAH